MGAVIYSQTIAQTAKYKSKCCILEPKTAERDQQFVIVPLGSGLGEADCDEKSVNTAAYCVSGVDNAELISPGNSAKTQMRDSEGNSVPVPVRNPSLHKYLCLIKCFPSRQSCKIPLQEAEGFGDTVAEAQNACNANLNKQSLNPVRAMTIGEHDPATSRYDRRLFGNGSRD